MLPPWQVHTYISGAQTRVIATVTHRAIDSGMNGQMMRDVEEDEWLEYGKA